MLTSLCTCEESAFADQLFDPCQLQQWECDEADHSRRRYAPRLFTSGQTSAIALMLRGFV